MKKLDWKTKKLTFKELRAIAHTRMLCASCSNIGDDELKAIGGEALGAIAVLSLIKEVRTSKKKRCL